MSVAKSSQSNSMTAAASSSDESIHQKGQKVLLILRNGGKRNLVEAFIPESQTESTDANSEETSCIPHYQEATLVNSLQRTISPIKEDDSAVLTPPRCERTRIPVAPKQPIGVKPDYYGVPECQQNNEDKYSANYDYTAGLDDQSEMVKPDRIRTCSSGYSTSTRRPNKDRDYLSCETRLVKGFALDQISGSVLAGALCGILSSLISKQQSKREKEQIPVFRKDTNYKDETVSTTTDKAQHYESRRSSLDQSFQLMLIVGMAHCHGSPSSVVKLGEPKGNLRLPKFNSSSLTKTSFLSKSTNCLVPGGAQQTNTSHCLPPSKLRALYQQHTLNRMKEKLNTESQSTELKQGLQQQPKQSRLRPSRAKYSSRKAHEHFYETFVCPSYDSEINPADKSVHEECLGNKRRNSEGTSSDFSQSEAPLEAIKPDAIHTSLSYLKAETFSSEIHGLSFDEPWNSFPEPSFPSIYQASTNSRLQQHFSSLFIINEELIELEDKALDIRNLCNRQMALNPFFGCNLDDSGNDRENDTGVRVPYPLCNIMYGAYMTEDHHELHWKQSLRELEELRTKWISVNDLLPKTNSPLEKCSTPVSHQFI
eukprot:g2971.t1